MTHSSANHDLLCEQQVKTHRSEKQDWCAILILHRFAVTSKNDVHDAYCQKENAHNPLLNQLPPTKLVSCFRPFAILRTLICIRHKETPCAIQIPHSAFLMRACDRQWLHYGKPPWLPTSFNAAISLFLTAYQSDFKNHRLSSMDNNPRICMFSIERCHKNGVSYRDGASVTLNVHSALTANTARILETTARLFFVSGIILEFHADLLKFCHSCTFFPPIYSQICCTITRT